MHRATFSIPCTDAPQAKVLHAAVAVETDDGPEGTTTTLTTEDASIQVDVQAADLSGLRAAIHSTLRLLDAARRSAGV